MVDQAKLLAILPKVSGPLSIFGSCWILRDIVKDKRKWSKPYHRLLFSMCVMDVFGSCGLMMSTWPIPSTSDRWGASGNDATCSAQAFFIQANISSPLFNFMLSLFFLLKVRYGYTDEQLSKRIEPLMQSSTLMFGIGTSIACLAMDMFADSSLWCWINATPKGCEQTFQHGYTTCETGDNAGIYRWAFFFAPLWAAALGSMVIMAMLYQHVRRIEQKAARWNFEANLDGSGEQQMEQQQQQQPYSLRSSTEKPSSLRSNTRPFMGMRSQSLRDLRRVELQDQHMETGTTVLSDESQRPSLNRTTFQRFLPGRSSKNKKDFRKSKLVARQAYRYCGVFYVTWIAGTVNRLLQLLNGGKSFYWIMVLHAIFTPLQGFLNFLIYMYPKYQQYRLMQQRRSASSMRFLSGASFNNNSQLHSNNLSQVPMTPPTSHRINSTRVLTTMEQQANQQSGSIVAVATFVEEGAKPTTRRKSKAKNNVRLVVPRSSSSIPSLDDESSSDGSCHDHDAAKEQLTGSTARDSDDSSSTLPPEAHPEASRSSIGPAWKELRRAPPDPLLDGAPTRPSADVDTPAPAQPEQAAPPKKAKPSIVSSSTPTKDKTPVPIPKSLSCDTPPDSEAPSSGNTDAAKVSLEPPSSSSSSSARPSSNTSTVDAAIVEPARQRGIYSNGVYTNEVDC